MWRGVTRGGGTQLSELFEVLQGDFVSRKVQPGVQEHRSMTSRQDEDVTIQPVRLFKRSISTRPIHTKNNNITNLVWVVSERVSK